MIASTANARHRRIPVRDLVAVAAALAAVTVTPGIVRAQDRVARWFGHEQGLTAPPVYALAQDSTGFLWIGAEGGLFRFDGTDIRQWAPDVVRELIASIAVSPQGDVVIQDHLGTIYRVTDRGVQRMAGPGPASASDNRPLAFDGSGRLWTVHEGRLAAREADGEWVVFEPDAFGGEPVRRVAVDRKGTVYVATRSAVWRMRCGTPPHRLAALGSVVDLLPLPDGRLLALTWGSRIVELGAGGPRDLLPRDVFGTAPPRGVALAVRGETIWAAVAGFLVALHPDERPVVLGSENGIVGPGPLLVDHEGSLWLASFRGLAQYSEPETRNWRKRHGLPSDKSRFVVRAGERIWVTTWDGTAVVERARDEWRVETVPWLERGEPCVDAGGDVWLGTPEALMRVRGDSPAQRFPAVAGHLYGCAAGEEGLWLASASGLLHALPEAGMVRRVPDLPFDSAEAWVTAPMLDRNGRLWIARDERVCAAPEAGVAGRGPAGWECGDVAGGSEIADLMEVPADGVWAATRGGVFTLRDGEWRPVPASLELPTRTIFRLVSSPAGGIWVTGHGILQRVRVRPDLPGGWEVLERLSAWHGLPAASAQHLVEDDDGTLWIATVQDGLFQVPPQARFATSSPPRVAVVDAWVDQDRTATASPLTFPLDHGIEIRFAAFSFRDPSRLHYQVRLSESEPWTDASGPPAFRWVRLPPGRHRAEFRASLDGQNWSAEPARLAFTVRPPWYREPWALALFALLGTTSLLAAYRARVAFLLRLERQRTRIAMDLHDEVGSGLASIVILSELAANGAQGDIERKTLVNEISTASQDLSSALSDLVWSLDRRPNTLKDLADRLADHGTRLFSNGRPRFCVRLPESWPSTPVAFPVRRSVLLIGLEALHNAVRHSGAHAVTLSLERQGTGWLLGIDDDGVGLPADVLDRCDDRRGLGVKSMRERARRIGAEIEWRSAPGQGAAVLVRFDLRGRGRKGLGLPVIRRRPQSIARDSRPRTIVRLTDRAGTPVSRH